MRGNALTGAGYLVRGASLLTRPTLRLFVLVPLAVNILIFSAVIWWGVSFLAGWLDSIMAGIPDWLGFLEWLLWPLVGLLVTLTTGYLFTAVAIVIASPFNNLLAEKVEEMLTGREVAGLEGLGAALAGVPRGIFRELAKLLYFVPMAALGLLLPRALSGKLLSHRRQAIADGKSEAGVSQFQSKARWLQARIETLLAPKSLQK